MMMWSNDIRLNNVQPNVGTVERRRSETANAAEPQCGRNAGIPADFFRRREAALQKISAAHSFFELQKKVEKKEKSS